MRHEVVNDASQVTLGYLQNSILFFFSSIACLFMGKVINIKLGFEDHPIKQDVSLSIHLTRAHRNSHPILLAETWPASKRPLSLLAFHWLVSS